MNQFNHSQNDFECITQTSKLKNGNYLKKKVASDMVQILLQCILKMDTHTTFIFSLQYFVLIQCCFAQMYKILP